MSIPRTIFIRDASDISPFLSLVTNPSSNLHGIKSIVITLHADDYDSFSDDMLAMALNQFHPVSDTTTNDFKNPHALQKFVFDAKGEWLYTRFNYTLISPVMSEDITKTGAGNLKHFLKKGRQARGRNREKVAFRVISGEKAWVASTLKLRGIKDVQVLGNCDGYLKHLMQERLSMGVDEEAGPEELPPNDMERVGVFENPAYTEKRAEGLGLRSPHPLKSMEMYKSADPGVWESKGKVKKRAEDDGAPDKGSAKRVYRKSKDGGDSEFEAPATPSVEFPGAAGPSTPRKLRARRQMVQLDGMDAEVTEAYEDEGIQDVDMEDEEGLSFEEEEGLDAGFDEEEEEGISAEEADDADDGQENEEGNEDEAERGGEEDEEEVEDGDEDMDDAEEEEDAEDSEEEKDDNEEDMVEEEEDQSSSPSSNPSPSSLSSPSSSYSSSSPLLPISTLTTMILRRQDPYQDLGIPRDALRKRSATGNQYSYLPARADIGTAQPKGGEWLSLTGRGNEVVLGWKARAKMVRVREGSGKEGRSVWGGVVGV